MPPSGISPIELLFIAGNVAGIATPIGLAALLITAGDRRLMDGRPVRRILLSCGWAVRIVIGALSLVFAVQQIVAVASRA